VYLPNAVDVELFRPQGEKEDNLLLYLGRIAPNKGLPVLLDSLRYLKKSVRLAMVGPVDCSIQYYQDFLNLIERENQKGIHEIKYLGRLPQTEIIKWYQKASIFILPSLWAENHPVVILEAHLCETPVIATAIGGVPEVVQNHKNGILVPLNNSPKLAKAIQYLLDNKDVRIRMGQEGRKWVIRKFSLEVIAKKLCNIYQKSISVY